MNYKVITFSIPSPRTGNRAFYKLLFATFRTLHFYDVKMKCPKSVLKVAKRGL